MGQIITKNNIDTYIPKLTTDDARYELKNLQNIQKEINKTQGSWDTYNKYFKGGRKYLQDYARTHNVLEANVDDLKKATQDAREEVIQYNNSLGNMTLKAKAGRFAINGLKMAMGMLATWGIAFVLESTISLLSDFVNAAEITAEKANNFSQALSSSNAEFAKNSKSLSKLNERYKTLSKGVNSAGFNISLSNKEYEEYKDTISQISEIMPDLALQHNAQGEAISFEKGQLSDLNEEYNRYRQNQVRKFLVNGDEDGNKFSDVLENYKNQSMFLQSVNDGILRSASQIRGVIKSFFGGNGLDDVLSAREIVTYDKQILSKSKKELVEWYEEMSSIPGIILDGTPFKTTDILQDYMLGYEVEEIEEMTDAQFNELHKQLIARNQKYQDVLKQDLQDVKQGITAILYSDDKFWEFDSSQQDYIQNLVDSFISDEFIQTKFIDKKSGEISENLIREFITNVMESTSDVNKQALLKKLFTFDTKDIPYSEYVKQIGDIIDDLVETIEKNPKLQDEMKLNLKLKFGINDDNNLLEQVKKKVQGTEIIEKKYPAKQIPARGVIYANKNIPTTPFVSIKKENPIPIEDEVDKWLQTLSKDDLELLLTLNPQIEGYSLEELKEQLEELKNKASETDIDTTSISSTVKHLSEKLQPAFDNLKSAYAEIFQVEDGQIKFSLAEVDPSMLEGLKKEIQEIFGEGVEIDPEVTEVYENFVKTLTNSSSTSAQVQEAFNSMATSILNSSNCMNNLNEETKNLMISSLESLGVTNAEAVVNDRLSIAKQGNAMATQFLEEVEETEKNTGKEVNSVSEETVDAFLNKQTASEGAKLKMLQLVAANERFNNTSLDVTQKIENLRNLALTAGEAGAAIATALNLQDNKVYSALSALDAVQNKVGINSHVADDYLKSLYEKEYQKFQDLFLGSTPNFNGNTGADSKSGSNKGSGGKGSSSSPKEFETDDEYHNPFDAKISDYEKGAEKYKETIEDLNKQIEYAYKIGDTDLAKSLEKSLSSKRDEFNKYLASSSADIRKLTQDQILPQIYEVVPEFKGKSFSELTEEDKEKIKLKLEKEILDQKNKVIALENAQKSDDKSKVSDAEVKVAEMKKKKYESLLATLEKVDGLVGNKNGEGSFSEQYRDVLINNIDQIKELFEKDIDKIDFQISLFEDSGNLTGQINSAKEQMALAHAEAEAYREKGLAENSEAIQETQKKYRESFKSIFEISNETFDRLIEKRDDLLNNLDFKLDMSGEKEYDERVNLLNQKLGVHQQKISDIVKEREKLTATYKNNAIVAEEYEDRLRELHDSEQDEVNSLKAIYETLRDIEIAKLDDQIDDITRATDKQTKALDDQIEALEEENDELEKLKNLYDKAYSAVQKVVNDQLELLDEQKEKEEEYWDEKLEALDKINEENQRAIELAEKQKALAEASQKTSMVYHEDTGWQYEANPNELSNAQQDLQQWLIDDQFEQAKKSIEEQKEEALQALDDQIEAWNNYLDFWADALEIYENETNDAAAKTVIGINYVSQVLAQNTGIATKFGNEYADILRRIGDEETNGIAKQIADLNKQKDEIQKNSDARIEALENEKAVWEELFTKGMVEDVDTFVAHLEEKFGVVKDTMKNAREMLSNFTADLKDTSSEAAKAIQYNNDDLITIQQMKNNSQQWAESEDNEKTRKQLHEGNQKWADTLSFNAHFDKEKWIWVDDNGNNIYDLLQDNLSENSNIDEKYIDAIEENTAKFEKNVDENIATTQENIAITQENIDTIKSNTSTQSSNIKQNKNLNANLAKTTSALQDVADNAEKLADTMQNNSANNSAGNSNGSSTSSGNTTENGSTSSDINASTDGTPYFYNSTLLSADEEIAKQWFADNHQTYPGSDVKVVHGSVSAMSSSLINELGLSNGELVVLGKSLYQITNGGWKKVTGSLINAYATGSKYIPYSQTALVDEEGEEFIVRKNSQGRITHLEKGDEVVPAKDTQTLVSLVDYINSPKKSNIPAISPKKNVTVSSEFIKLDCIPLINVNPMKDLVKDMLLNAPNAITNNNVHNNNYNIQKVELNKTDNAEDLFKGIENLARQRSMRR